MTMSGAAGRLEEMRRRLVRWQLYVPYATLASSLILVAVAAKYDPEIPHRPWSQILGLVAFTVLWQLWWVTRHSKWGERRTPKVIFFVGLIVLAGLLIWCSSLFGFFAWTGYLYTAYALPGLWCVAGAGAVAFLGATSQMGGFPIFDDPPQLPAFFVVLAINEVIGMVMTYLAVRDNQQSEKRSKMLDELAEANAKLEAALKENAGLHAQLMAQAREAGVLDERQRMAGEIHDVLAQGFTGIVTQLEAAEGARADDAWRRHLDAAKRLARDSLAEARRSVQALRPQPLESASLPDVIGELVDSWSDLQGISAELITTGEPRRLLPEIETTLLRTAQEALANVARHAAAGRVGLTLSYMEDLVTLDVRDDGSGFDPEAPPDPGYAGGYGLSAMRERVARIAGTLAVESEPGAGTAISACVPAITMGSAA